MYAHEIVAKVTDRLKDYITGLEIAAFPDKPGDYRLRHPRGALLVHYAGSEADKARRPRIAVRSVARFEGDALFFLEAARIIINGWQIPGCTRFEYAGDEFIEEKQGIWEYDIVFTTATPAQPVAEGEVKKKLQELGIT
jgi:hypothetical protein